MKALKKILCIVNAAALSLVALACVACTAPREEPAPTDEPKENQNKGGVVTVVSRINIDISDGPLALPYTVDGGSDGTVEWTSDYASIAAVDKEGTLYPVAEGTTEITAKTSTYVTTFEVNVTNTYGSYTKLRTVEDIERLAESKEYVKKTSKFCLANDIDFDGKTIQPLGGWSKEDAFNGIFDGRGYALKNFSVHNPESCKVTDEGTGQAEYFGVSLFPFIDVGTVCNLSLVNVNFSGYGFTGGIAGQLESGLIENCYVSGTISATAGFSSSVPAGGICGIIGAKGVVKNVYLNLDVFGGFVFAGFNFGTGSNCVARADAVTAIRNGETLLLCTDNTGKTGEEGQAENEQLKQFDEDSSLVLSDTKLTSLKNYPFTKDANWAIVRGYTAFVARPDGIAPDWAKSNVS